MDAVRTLRARLLATLTCLAIALLLLAPPAATAGLKDRIAAALAAQGMGGSGTSVAVFDLTAKRTVYQLRPDVLRLPASNQKLVTSSAALAGWTSTYRFSTHLFIAAPGPDEDGVVHGDVYLRGLGDPTLSTASFQSRYFGMKTSDVHDFVARLTTLGVTRITGRVVADDGYFDRARTVANWRPSMIAFCGPLSALTLNEGFGSNGRYVQRSLAVGGEQADEAASRRRHPRDAHAGPRHRAQHRDACVHGALGRPEPHPGGDEQAERQLPRRGAAQGPRCRLRRGRHDRRRRRRRQTLPPGIGLTEGFRIRDGSGLSYQDKLSARAILRVLGAMAKRSDFSVFWRSLAVAGVDGTLRYRMRGTSAAGNVHAKTGTLNAASSLSGYVTTANRHTLSFSILMNGSGLPVSRAHAAQDAVAVILARSTP